MSEGMVSERRGMSTRQQAVICLLVTVPLGFGLKYYPGPGHAWCNLYGAAVLYEIFWCLAACAVFSQRKNITAIAVSVLAATCLLECLQLWHPPVLEAIRSYEAGVWLIGNGFDWLDFPHYVLGCGLGWLAMRAVGRNEGADRTADLRD